MGVDLFGSKLPNDVTIKMVPCCGRYVPPGIEGSGAAAPVEGCLLHPWLLPAKFFVAFCGACWALSSCPAEKSDPEVINGPVCASSPFPQ